MRVRRRGKPAGYPTTRRPGLTGTLGHRFKYIDARGWFVRTKYLLLLNASTFAVALLHFRHNRGGAFRPPIPPLPKASLRARTVQQQEKTPGGPGGYLPAPANDGPPAPEVPGRHACHPIIAKQLDSNWPVRPGAVRLLLCQSSSWVALKRDAARQLIPHAKLKLASYHYFNHLGCFWLSAFFALPQSIPGLGLRANKIRAFPLFPVVFFPLPARRTVPTERT